MTAGNLIGMPDSRSYPSCLDPEAELTPEQSKELIQTASTASHSLTTLLVGVGAIGDLLANTASSRELSQDAALRLGWFLEEISCIANALNNVQAAAYDYGWRPLPVKKQGNL